MSEPARRSPTAFRTSLTQRLKTAAASSGRPLRELQREFVLQRFLARVFAVPDSPWILKGGTGLLVRLPGARHSQDLDLACAQSDLDTALADLHRACGRDGGDPFAFRIARVRRMAGRDSGAEVTVEASLGVTRYHTFPVDVITQVSVVAALERQQPQPPIHHPDVTPLPEVTLYPLPDQVADKVCAMYQAYGTAAPTSTRYRDLVDLVLVISNFTLDATQTREALEAEAHRRSMTLPSRLEPPARDWTDGYRPIARASRLPTQLHELPAALERAGRCLNPLLDRTVTTGTWQPDCMSWRRTV